MKYEILIGGGNTLDEQKEKLEEKVNNNLRMGDCELIGGPCQVERAPGLEKALIQAVLIK